MSSFLGVRVYPSRLYAIARDHSTKAILEVTIDSDYAKVFLREGNEIDLPIIKLSKPVVEGKATEASTNQSVRFLIYWRKTSSSWLWQVPVPIMTSTDDIERMAKAVAAQRDE
jgi:hypothetical protein